MVKARGGSVVGVGELVGVAGSEVACSTVGVRIGLSVRQPVKKINDSAAMQNIRVIFDIKTINYATKRMAVVI